MLGLAGGALNALANGTDWQNVLLSVGIALFGFVSKDFRVSGTGKTGTM